jgi:hypothetical protein
MSSRGPRCVTIRDGTQGTELATRNPLTDAARNTLVSSWRRLSRHIRRCLVMNLAVAASEEEAIRRHQE